jgi:hypothetical protein
MKYCRARKKPRERRFELHNMLFERYSISRLLAFYGAIKYWRLIPQKGKYTKRMKNGE